MLERFKETRFRASSLLRIEQANKIIAEYMKDGLTLTLRQLYYQFVARGLIQNSPKEYKNLGGIINEARLAGLIDWDSIEDRTRNVRQGPFWDGQAHFLDSVAPQYKVDIWDSQPTRPEVWIEKDALIGVIETECRRRRVPILGCRGYTSQSEQYAAGKRFADVRMNGQTPILFYLGDHDPSGIDMSRDHEVRLEMFAGEEVEVRRLALNYNQVERYSPPPNPTKMKDSRSPGYVRKFGKKSWELDALEPRVIGALIKNALNRIIDEDDWQRRLAEEDEERQLVVKVAKKWPLVKKYLAKLED